MQQPQPMIPVMSSFPHTNITTEQIQKYLDENKKLILAILDNQNLGKLAECAQYQAQLQKNLMYLAAIADAQPQAPGIPPPMAPHPAMQQGGFYMQNPQAAAMAQQPGVFPPKVPVQFSNPLQMMQQQQQLHQQQIQGQMNMRPGAASNGMHPTRTEVSLGGSSGTVPPASTTMSDVHGGSKQDNQNAAAGTESQGASAATHGGEASAEAK